MNAFPENEIREVNKMLHKLLGLGLTKLKISECETVFTGEGFLGKQTSDNRIKLFSENETLNLLKKCSDDTYLNIFRFLNFYYPRWIAFNIIKESDDKYAEYSSNNELIIALTSIIDRVSKTIKRKKVGYTKKFITFLKDNLSDKDIAEIKKAKIYKEGKRKNVENLDDIARYIYKIRSLVVHEAELGGIYPYCVGFDLDITSRSKIKNFTFMITPEVFRRLLWKAIFNYLGLKIIYPDEETFSAKPLKKNY